MSTNAFYTIRFTVFVAFAMTVAACGSEQGVSTTTVQVQVIENGFDLPPSANAEFQVADYYVVDAETPNWTTLTTSETTSSGLEYVSDFYWTRNRLTVMAMVGFSILFSLEYEDRVSLIESSGLTDRTSADPASFSDSFELPGMSGRPRAGSVLGAMLGAGHDLDVHRLDLASSVGLGGFDDSFGSPGLLDEAGFDSNEEFGLFLDQSLTNDGLTEGSIPRQGLFAELGLSQGDGGAEIIGGMLDVADDDLAASSSADSIGSGVSTIFELPPNLNAPMQAADTDGNAIGVMGGGLVLAEGIRTTAGALGTFLAAGGEGMALVPALAAGATLTLGLVAIGVGIVTVIYFSNQSGTAAAVDPSPGSDGTPETSTPGDSGTTESTKESTETTDPKTDTTSKTNSSDAGETTKNSGNTDSSPPSGGSEDDLTPSESTSESEDTTIDTVLDTVTTPTEEEIGRRRAGIVSFVNTLAGQETDFLRAAAILPDPEAVFSGSSVVFDENGNFGISMLDELVPCANNSVAMCSEESSGSWIAELPPLEDGGAFVPGESVRLGTSPRYDW